MNVPAQRNARFGSDRGSEIVTQSSFIVSHNEAKIREWLLRLLRFAITHDSTDRATAFHIADEMDAVCLRWRPSGPTFFARTTQEMCAAILSSSDPAQSVILKKHLRRIDEPRLKRAFEAVLSLDAPQLLPKTRPGRGSTQPIDLWKDLRA